MVPMEGVPLPAFSPAAELAVIGSMLVDRSQIDVVRRIVNADDFYRDSHQIVFAHILRIHDDGKTPDLLAVEASLKRSGEFDRIGGGLLFDAVREAGDLVFLAPERAAVVREDADLRFAAAVGDRLRANQWTREANADEAMGRAAAELTERAGRSPGGSACVPLDTVAPVSVEWLWPGRIPLGKLTLLAGPGGVGKTFLSLDVASRVSVGGPVPDRPDERFDKGSVLFISAEDDPADTLVPRLLASGADTSKIRVLGPAVHGRFSLADIATLVRAKREVDDLGLIVIDPPTAYVGPIDDHKNAELRSILAPLSKFASQYGVAVLMVTHVSKSTSSRASDRIIGSVAWSNAVRSAWLVKKDDADKSRRLVLPVKNNLAPTPTGLAYRIVQREVEGVRDPQGVVEWESGTIDMDADDACVADSGQRGGRPPAKLDDAVAWLKEYLADGVAYPSGQLKTAAEKRGIKFDTFRKAKDELGVRSKKMAMDAGWYCGLGDPDKWTLAPVE